MENTNNKSKNKPVKNNLKSFKEILNQNLDQLTEGKINFSAQDFLKDFVKIYLETVAQVELEEHLGYKKHDSENRNTDNYRNGVGSKKVRGDFGEVVVEVPRDRKNTFEPQIIKKRESNLGNFSEKIISLYARGMTTREIEEHLHEMYGIDISPQFISRATEVLQEEICDWQNRPLDPIYVTIYVDGLRVSIKSDNNQGPVMKKCVYIVLGLTTTGDTDVLGLWIQETEGAKFWLNVFNDLKSRGVKDVLLMCGDGLKGLDKAVEQAFPEADLQTCVVHQVRYSTSFVSHKDRKEFCIDMRKIYTSPTIEAAEEAFNDFANKWEAKYPASIRSWRDNWNKLTTFYKYPLEFRKMIYTTNKIESLNSLLRKNISNRKIFPNDKSLIKILFLNIKNFTKKWTKIRDWRMIHGQLDILFPDRLQKYSNDLINNAV